MRCSNAISFEQIAFSFQNRLVLLLARVINNLKLAKDDIICRILA